jgi:limonene-1,2-epoxide hydrolase
MNDTKRVVESFLAAWTSRNEAAARELMADNIVFISPMSRYESAEEFIGPLMRFASMLHEHRVHQLLVEGDRAALYYDCEMPPPIGTLTTASFYRVENGKIREYRSVFDCTNLRKVLG